MSSAAPSSIRLPYVAVPEEGNRMRFESILAARIWADAQPQLIGIHDAVTGDLIETR